MKARVVIRNKSGVFDPEGKVVEGGLRRLGYANVEQVRVGKVVDIELRGTRDEATEEIHRMCRQFLVNPVIEDYSIQWLDEGT